MTDQDAIRRGRDFEHLVAKMLGGNTTPGSGNKFYAKGDVEGAGFLVQCKSQQRFYWPEIKEYLKEAIDDAFGSGKIGLLALEDFHSEKGIYTTRSEQYVVLKLDDLVKAFSENIRIEDRNKSKGIEKRETAEIPLMLRR